MKKLLLFALLLTIVNLNAQYFKSPKEYLSYVFKEENTVAQTVSNYSRNLAHKTDFLLIETTKKQSLTNIQEAIVKINMLNGYNGDLTYQAAVIAYMSSLQNMINQSYEDVLLFKNPDDFLNSDPKLKNSVLQEEAHQKFFKESQGLSVTRFQFAQKYGVKLEPLQKEIALKNQRAFQVNTYISKFYAAFFPCNYLDIQLHKAIQTENVEKIKLISSKMTAYATEGIRVLKQQPGFDEDYSIIMELQKSMTHYLDETQNLVPLMLHFIEAKQKFALTKEGFSKIENQANENEILEYNVKVRVYNDGKNRATNTYTTYINKSNSIVADWNKVSTIFLHRHYPK